MPDGRGANHAMLRIRKIRKARPDKMSVRVLAERVGVNSGHMSRIESGARWPKFETLLAIAEVLDVPVHTLFESCPEPSPAAEQLLERLNRADEKTLARVAAVIDAILDN